MLTILSAGLSLASGIMGASSARRQGRAKAKAARNMAKYNAEVRETEAESIYNIMQMEQERLYREKRSGQAQVESAILKSGATMTGTGLKVAIANSANKQRDILIARSNRLQQIQFKQQAAKGERYKGEVQAESAIAEAEAKAQASLLSGFSGALTSGIKAYSAGEFSQTKNTKVLGDLSDIGIIGDINIDYSGGMYG